MKELKTLYYEHFVRFIVEQYSSKLKQVPAGHCIKITGLAMKELLIMLPQLRALNPQLSAYILSETEKGDEFIHATKLIELRNDPTKSVLILVPSNIRTSAEDSYGDATFQNLSTANEQQSFFFNLVESVPVEKRYIWKQINELMTEIGTSLSEMIYYLLYIELNAYIDEAWGNGLFCIGMLPDSDLIKSDSIRRRFFINKEKVSINLGDFTMPASDRIVSLPLERNTIQKDLMRYLISNNTFEDRHSLFEDILINHPEFNYAKLPWIIKGEGGKVKISVDLVPGSDPNKELVTSEEGDFVLGLKPDKKGKIAFTIESDPSPKDNPDIYSFEIALVNVEDFQEVGVVKKLKVGTNKRSKRKSSVSISCNTFDTGEYVLRVRALDENGVILEQDKVFKEERVQEAWFQSFSQNNSLQMEQYRLDNHVLYSNETAVFTIDNSGDELVVLDSIDKRAKVTSITQAIIHYRISHLIKDEALEIPAEKMVKRIWVEGSLNDNYQFDFGSAYAYQIQYSKKLIQLERAFLEANSQFGHVEAFLSGNMTDSTLFDPFDTAIRKPLFVPFKEVCVNEELSRLREELFDLIRSSSENNAGLICTFDFTSNIGLVKNYISEYNKWLSEELEKEQTDVAYIEIQNCDTVDLSVEMPDGTTSIIKLISPLHPLRMAWMVNLYELYQDWEEQTLENPKFKKSWFRKLDKLFQGGLPLDIAPLVLGKDLLQEAYQYIGELTFGWAAYASPLANNNDTFSSGYRQLKSYTAILLNIVREMRIDSDVNVMLVTRHLFNYSLSHPYTDKLVINLFNAGDAAVFAQALIELERLNIGKELSYEIRLFADDDILQSGEAFADLLSPDSAIASEAEVFSQASANRLFPKLRFSINKIGDFVKKHDKYQAHLSFLVNPFAVHTELVRPDEFKRSFYLNGTISRTIVNAAEEGKDFIWNRLYSNKILSNPVTEFANTEVSLFSRLQEITGHILSSTIEESVPATTLRLKSSDKMLLSFIHESSDWVVTFDKNMGPEYYDLPCNDANAIPYLLDYIPNDDATGVSSYLTTKPTSEIGAIMIPLFKDFGINIEDKANFAQILEDVRSVSSSLIMHISETRHKGFEIIGTTLTKRFLQKKHLLSSRGIMDESFIIPIDLHKELFENLDNEKKSRADNLVVKIDTQKREILFTVVEIKCRKSVVNKEELHNKILEQINNTIIALRQHFEIAVDGCDRLDRELKIIELRNFLEFYIRRSIRYNGLNPEIAHQYFLFLSTLGEGYSLRFKHLGIIYDFSQQERQKKDFYGEAVIYSMGLPVVNEILDDSSTLNTQKLSDLDNEADFVRFFEPSFMPSIDHEEFIKPVVSLSKPKVFEAENEIIIPDSIILSSNASEPEIVNGQTNEDEIKEREEINQSAQETVSDSGSKCVPENHELDERKTKEIISKEEDYFSPNIDVLIGKNSESPQYGVLGRVISNGRRIGLDLNECNTISLFGVQGAGKSYTIGSITEMVLRQFSKVNKLPAPMTSVIFHYSDSMDYAPEFTSMVYPNDDAGQLAKLKDEYGAEAASIKDVILLAPESQVSLRKKEYPDLEVFPIGFDSSELSVKDWMFLLGAVGNDSTYIKELKQIMKSCRYDMNLQNIRNGVQENEYLNSSQRKMAQQKLDFASEYISDGAKLQRHMHPGRLIIVDLRDEFIEKDDALGLFVVMLNIFSGVLQVDGNAFNKFIVFDEAHKYMNNKDLVGSITTAIREMRHKGVSIMIASQDPMSLPTEIIELSSIVVMHRFSSPAWVKHVQKAITPLQTLTPTEMSMLGSGEAYIWANKATDKSITQRPIKISIRPRITKHGGDTIQAVK